MQKLIALLAVGLSLTTPAIATPNKATQEEIEEHSTLIELIRAVGVPVNFGGKFCQDTGFYGGYETTGKELVLCRAGDSRDRLNTVRHEAFHVYQDLQDCDLADEGYVKPVFAVDLVPTEIKTWAAKNYSKPLINAEAEAQWAAEMFTARQINVLLYQKAKACGYKF